MGLRYSRAPAINTMVVDMEAEGIPAHCGGGTRCIKGQWIASSCSNENQVRLFRSNDKACAPPECAETITPIPVNDGDALWVRVRLYFPRDFAVDGRAESCNTDTSPNHLEFIRPHFSVSPRYAPTFTLAESGMSYSSDRRWNLANLGRGGLGGETPGGRWFSVEIYARIAPTRRHPAT